MKRSKNYFFILKTICNVILITCLHNPFSILNAQCAAFISSFPYLEDFELSDGGWTTGGTNNDWAWGSPSKPLINSAGSGIKCWITGGTSTSFYNYGERSFVQSPCFDFSSLTNPHITFSIFWETEFIYDGACFQYSVNGGISWNNVGAYGDATDCMNQNWYNYATVNGLSGLAVVKNGWCGNMQPSSGSCVGGSGSGSWLVAKHAMPYLAGQSNVIFRFAFGAGTTCNSFDGFAFDNITIENAALPVTVNPILQPAGCTVNDGSATLTVNGGITPYSFLWNPNVSTGSSAAGLSAGNYAVTVTDAAGCSKLNALTIGNTAAVSFAAFTFPDTCERQVGAASVNVLSGTPPFSYLWNAAGNTAAAINNLSAGSYLVIVTDTEGCSKSMNVKIDEVGSFTIHLGSDTTICSGTGIILSPGKFYQYQWQDNSSDSVFEITSLGTYWVEVTSIAGCRASDTIEVIEDCLHDIIVPNAFSPNDDAVNDLFTANAVTIKSFKMEIYNRWGERVFESNSIKSGWNGIFKSRRCETGIYAWVINYSLDGTEKKEKSGIVLLIR